MNTAPTGRFSDRVENYVQYRPGYPQQAIDFLIDEFTLSSLSVVADIGSGTGIFTKYLLNHVYRVFAVEPNEPMRLAAEEHLSKYTNVTSVAGTAEHTNLPAGSIDLITSATAFHWFDVEQARDEFKRILKPDGAVALLWNVKNPDADEFSVAYKNLVDQYTIDADEKAGLLNGQRLKDFFANGEYKTTSYPNQQVFDQAGLIGRSFSSSNAPLPYTLDGNRFTNDLKDLFHQYQVEGTVTLHYNTMVYTGRV